MKTKKIKVNGIKREYVIQNELIRRGWTRTMVNKFLISEDYSIPSHIKFNYPDLKYYLVDRVNIVESRDEFRNYYNRYVSR